MKYWANYMADAVVREDGRGTRFYKIYDGGKLTKEQRANKDSKVAYGGVGFGVIYKLKPITQEQYLAFGKGWEFGEDGNINLK